MSARPPRLDEHEHACHDGACWTSSAPHEHPCHTLTCTPGDVGVSVVLARTVSCGWCAAPADEPCRENGARLADRVHDARLRAWVRRETGQLVDARRS